VLLSTSKPEDFEFFADIPHLDTGAVVGDVDEAIALLQTRVESEGERRAALLQDARLEFRHFLSG